MASLIYNSCVEDAFKGAIDFNLDNFKCMLVTSGYAPSKGHSRRSDVSNEVKGAGYTAGGMSASMAVAKDGKTNKIDITLGGVTMGTSTVSARGAVYYKSRGGAASGDELVAYIDFGTDVTSTNGPWTLSASTLRIQN